MRKHGSARPRLLSVAVGAIAGVLFAGSVAFATIPGAGGLINGCYEKRIGILRVIDAEAGKKCLSIETPISWSQQGPKGDAGVAGPQGPQGDLGPQGAKGDPGTPAPLYTAGRGLELSGTEFQLAFDPAQVAGLQQELDDVKAQTMLQGNTLGQLGQLINSVSNELNLQGTALGQFLQQINVLESQMNDVKARLDQLKTHVCGIDPKGPAC